VADWGHHRWHHFDGAVCASHTLEMLVMTFPMTQASWQSEDLGEASPPRRSIWRHSPPAFTDPGRLHGPKVAASTILPDLESWRPPPGRPVNQYRTTRWTLTSPRACGCWNAPPGTLRALLAGLPPAWTDATEGPDTWSPCIVMGHRACQCRRRRTCRPLLSQG
jgi:hypothetical protein